MSGAARLELLLLAKNKGFAQSSTERPSHLSVAEMRKVLDLAGSSSSSSTEIPAQAPGSRPPKDVPWRPQTGHKAVAAPRPPDSMPPHLQGAQPPRSPPTKRQSSEMTTSTNGNGESSEAPRAKWRAEGPAPPKKPPPAKLLQDTYENQGEEAAKKEAQRRIGASLQTPEDKEDIDRFIDFNQMGEEVTLALRLLDPIKLRKFNAVMQDEVQRARLAEGSTQEWRSSHALAVVGEIDASAEKIARKMYEVDYKQSLGGAGSSPARLPKTIPPQSSFYPRGSVGSESFSRSAAADSAASKPRHRSRSRSRSHQRAVGRRVLGHAAAAAARSTVRDSEGMNPLRDWLLGLDSSGEMLQYLVPLRREFTSLAQIAATLVERPERGASVRSCVDPEFWEALHVESLGHQSILAKGILALASETEGR